MKSRRAAEANTPCHGFMFSACPLTAEASEIGDVISRIRFCAQSSRKCQNRSGNPLPLLPGPGSQLHNKDRGINTSVAGRPSPGQQTTEIKDQDKEDAAEATAKRFRSFGLEVSVWPCSHSEKEQPPNSQCYHHKKRHHKGNTRRRKNTRVQLTLFEGFLLFRNWNRNLWKSFFTCLPGKGCLSRYLLLF